MRMKLDYKETDRMRINKLHIQKRAIPINMKFSRINRGSFSNDDEIDKALRKFEQEHPIRKETKKTNSSLEKLVWGLDEQLNKLEKEKRSGKERSS